MIDITSLDYAFVNYLREHFFPLYDQQILPKPSTWLACNILKMYSMFSLQ